MRDQCILSISQSLTNCSTIRSDNQPDTCLLLCIPASYYCYPDTYSALFCLRRTNIAISSRMSAVTVMIEYSTIGLESPVLMPPEL